MRRVAAGLAALVVCVTPPAIAQTGEGHFCTQQDFDAFLATLKPVEGRITLEVTPNRAEWKIGEQARFSVASPAAGELLLMSIDAKGVAFPIFPNAHLGAGDSARIKAGQTITLPQPGQGFGFEVQGPVGPSRLIAIVRPEGRDLPLPCTRPLTKGASIDIRPGAGNAPPPLPKIFEGWGYALFDYVVRDAE